jgi:sec-independent protein translocase protein TatC
LLVGGLIGYYLQDGIISLLVKPLGQKLVYFSPTGGFEFLIKVCLFFGFLVSVPMGVYQLIRFIAPAIPRKYVIKSGRILVLSSLLASLGVLFAYIVSLPAALHFLNSFSNRNIESLISANEYSNFVMIYLAGFAALFQMPLIFWATNHLKPLRASALMRQQRWVILISFIVAAILTPTPDPINQTLMAVPIILLYQVSVAVIWFANRRNAVANGANIR